MKCSGFSILNIMTKQDIDNYLELEFDVTSPSELSERDRIIAYERLRHQVIESNFPADKHTATLILISEYLEV